MLTMLESIIPPVITQNMYLHSLTILVFFFIVVKLLVWVIQKWLLRITARTKTDVDDKLVGKVNGPLSFLISLVGIKLALLPLNIGEPVLFRINQGINSFIVVTIGYALIGINGVICEYLAQRAEKTESKADDQLVMLFKRFMKVIIFILVFLFILRIWGVEIGPMLASLGIAGIAIAFALQNTLGNIFGGVSMILDRTIKVGDIVKLESGEMGSVFDIGLRATRIKTFDNEIIIVPNGQLSNGRIQNFVLPDPSIRVNVEFGVQYGADPEFIKAMAVEEVSRIKDVQKEPAPWVLFNSMGDNSLQFKVMFWVDDLSKKWPTHQEAITRIYRRLYKEDIGIPFPQRTVWMYDAGKAPKPSPYDKKYSRFSDRYGTTLPKKESAKNPEQEDTEKLEKDIQKESEQLGKGK